MTLQTRFRLFFIAGALLSIPEARGNIIVSVQSTIVTAGSSGNVLDVELRNTGPSAITVEGFSFGVATKTSDINFTQANISTSLPYIFAGESTFGPDITVASGQTLTASDLDISFAGVNLASGATVGLGHLLFDVALTARSGAIPVTLQAFPATSLADAQGNDILIQQLFQGQITIEGTASPEPSFLPVFAAGTALLVIRNKKLLMFGHYLLVRSGRCARPAVSLNDHRAKRYLY